MVKKKEHSSDITKEQAILEDSKIEPNSLPVPLKKGQSLPVPRLKKDAVIARGGTSVDALDAYLREIRSIPKLTREEEHELAVKFQDENDREAAYKLVSANLWLVVKLARSYEKAARTLLDLVQEGNIGLMEAVKNFDPFRGVRFPSYAVWWVKAYIVRYVLANWRMVKIGTTQAQRKLFFNLSKEKEKLEREGFYPAPKLIAERLNVREKDVVEMEQRLSGSDLSLDYPVNSGESDSNLMSIIPDSNIGTEDFVAQQQRATLLRELLVDFLDTLKPRDKVIFQSRMISEEKATLQELSQELEVSKERVRQIENQIKDKLRAFIEKSLGNRLSDVIEVD